MLLNKQSRWSNNFDAETDWNIVTPPMVGVDNRQIKLSRGRFLGGSSGCNGTLCIRGAKQDYDDWGLEGWNGEEFFKYMRKVGGDLLHDIEILLTHISPG
jgi:choline dehydrogenase-like flavoprotein